MREIKFRAWNGKEMISNYAHVGENGRMYTIHHTGKEPDYKVMQHTGLKDKNGKEIYEGDIVRKDGWSEPKEWRWVVEWSEKDSRFKPGRDFLVDCEVIGNIYENPELLTTQ